VTPTLCRSQVTIPNVLETFHPASEAQIAARSLQRRIDRKYVLPQRMLEPLLEMLSLDYLVVLSEDRRVATYDTLYFDTEDRQMYDDHRRGRRLRHKVRIRHYLDRELSFLEIKSRLNGYRTSKARMERSFGDSRLDSTALQFIGQHCPASTGLLPQIAIAYRRATLVGKHLNERLTLDWDIEFCNSERSDGLPGVVVAELKQERYSHSTLSVESLRRLGIREGGFSKYCLATARLLPVECSTFARELRAVEAVSR
jgi:hypothetical protein